MSTSVLALRELLQERFPGAQPVAPGGTARPAALGVAPLDRMLPEGGLPRGRLTQWRPGAGASALLRHACHAALERGERAAWVDADGTTCALAWETGPLLYRPADRVAALECAEELLRSGGFGVVVWARAGALPPSARAGAGGKTSRGMLRGLAAGAAGAGSAGTAGAVGAGDDGAYVRLSRVAREGGSALVVLAERTPVAALRVHGSVRPESYRWLRDPFGEPAEAHAVRVVVRASSGGWSGEVELELPVLGVPQRLALDATLPDRRGVKPLPKSEDAQPPIHDPRS